MENNKLNIGLESITTFSKENKISRPTIYKLIKLGYLEIKTIDDKSFVVKAVK